MPDFRFEGSPGAIEAKGAVLVSRGGDFVLVGDGLASLSTSGWTGRAADRFRAKFEVDPPRWREAGEGFIRAGHALTTYAGMLRWAQGEAGACATEWQRGDALTTAARSAYDADVRAARADKALHEAENGPGTYQLTIEPFVDPGASVRAGAERRFAAAKSALEAAAHEAAAGVRAGTSAAPASRNWLESGLAFVAGVFVGAGEALWGLGELAWSVSPMGIVFEVSKLATGELTPEEFAAKVGLKVETAQGLWTALTTDPVGFGKNMGKALLDWDTWADDPARALGHLVPDAVAAIFTGGTATAGTRGASAMGALARHGDELVEGAVDAGRVARRLDDLTDLRRLSGFEDLPRAPQDLGIDAFNNPAVDRWVDDVVRVHPELDPAHVRALFDYSTNSGYDAINGGLRTFGPMEQGVSQRVDNVRAALDSLQARPGTTYRGTNLPDSVLEEIARTGRLSDSAFTSSSVSREVAEGFIDRSKPNQTRITVEGVTGVDIKPFSAKQGEVEVLFRNGTSFDVLSNAVGADGVRHLVVREVVP